jgi:hypothetical protein
MLKNLDVVLAFAALMLILSLIVTTVVQALVGLLGLRGRNLLGGVSRLFQQFDPAFTTEISEEISRKLLGHPAVARTFGRATQAISKEELIRLANHLATASNSELTGEAKKVLREYLGKVVVAVPKGQQVALAAAAGALSEEARASFNNAVATAVGTVQQAGVDVAEWFDTVLDRTRDTFVLQTRVITAVAAVVLAAGLHVDSLYLLRQLASNDEARASLVQSAQPLLDQAARVQSSAAVEPEQARRQIAELSQRLSGTELVIFVKNWGDASLVGMAMTAVFLSLGAPFWFNLLRQLSSLRPSIARVVDPNPGQAGGQA